MVMGRDSRSKGRGFESWHCILDGHFFTYCKNCNVRLKRPKINEKEAGLAHYLKKLQMRSSVQISTLDFSLETTSSTQFLIA